MASLAPEPKGFIAWRGAVKPGPVAFSNARSLGAMGYLAAMSLNPLDAARHRLRGLLRRVATETLAPRRVLVERLGDDLARIRSRADGLRVDLDAVRGQLAAVSDELALRTMPFSADMTVDQAWRRHPGAASVFARHDLPGCDGCAVRFDETLQEAARAYDLDLDRLVEDLRALLR